MLPHPLEGHTAPDQPVTTGFGSGLIFGTVHYCSSERMKMDFNGSCLTTDYYSSRDRERGVPWCYVSAGTWHILLPHPPARRVTSCRALPVKDREDPDGWRWRLEIEAWHLPIYRRCFSPFRPGFPAKGERFERAAVLYTGFMSAKPGQSFFGSVQPGLQESHCTLWLVRGA